MNENDAVKLLNAMNRYMHSSEELAVMLADKNCSQETLERGQKQMRYSYISFQEAFYIATRLYPEFHPSVVVVQPGIVFPHGMGTLQDKLVWSEPHWTVGHPFA